MRRRLIVGCVILCGSLVSVRDVSGTAPAWLACENCHREGAMLETLKHHKLSSSDLTLREALDECVGCHEPGLQKGEKSFSYRVHRISGHSIYEKACAVCHANSEGNDYPMAWDCGTCHATHKNGEAFPSNQPCMDCHDGSQAATADAAHEIPPTEYQTSGLCKDCHRTDYDKWRNSSHSRIIREVGDPKYTGTKFGVLGTWADGTWSQFSLSDPNAGIPPVTVYTKAEGGVYKLKLGDPVTGPEYTVARTLGGGNAWKQHFLTKIGLSHYILPMRWVEAKNVWAAYGLKDWFDTAGNPRTPAKGRSYERRCAGCHFTTSSSVAYNETSQEYFLTFGESNVGCERCHRPAGGHLNAGGGPGVGTINPATFPDKLQRGELCGQCHSRGSSVYVNASDGLSRDYPWAAATLEHPQGRGYQPGESLWNLYNLISPPDPDLWGDTPPTSKGHRQEWLDFQNSPHYEPASMACWDCHDSMGSTIPHELKWQNDNNELCLHCHGTGEGGSASSQFAKPYDVEVPKHTRHAYNPANNNPPDPDGYGQSRCTRCHMPKVAISAAPYDVHAHTFETLVPASTLELAMPSSCAVSCHRKYANAAPGRPGYGDYSLSDWTEETDRKLAAYLSKFEEAWFEGKAHVLEVVYSANFVTFTWVSEEGKTYVVYRADGLGASATWNLLAEVLGKAGSRTSSFTDTDIIGPSSRFYRVLGVE